MKSTILLSFFLVFTLVTAQPLDARPSSFGHLVKLQISQLLHKNTTQEAAVNKQNNTTSNKKPQSPVDKCTVLSALQVRELIDKKILQADPKRILTIIAESHLSPSVKNMLTSNVQNGVTVISNQDFAALSTTDLFEIYKTFTIKKRKK